MCCFPISIEQSFVKVSCSLCSQVTYLILLFLLSLVVCSFLFYVLMFFYLNIVYLAICSWFTPGFSLQSAHLQLVCPCSFYTFKVFFVLFQFVVPVSVQPIFQSSAILILNLFSFCSPSSAVPLLLYVMIIETFCAHYSCLTNVKCSTTHLALVRFYTVLVIFKVLPQCGWDCLSKAVQHSWYAWWSMVCHT